MPRPDSSVVERGPEKAGVGGSIPSLATTIIINNLPVFDRNPLSLVERLSHAFDKYHVLNDMALT